MTNLFQYANKELEQDAFLCWLITNSGDDNNEYEDVKSIGRAFIKLVLGYKNDIKSLKIESIRKQFKHTDILAELLINGEKYILIIEDKVDANEGFNQTNKYFNNITNSFADKCCSNRIKFVFYKLNFVWESDRTTIQKNGWFVFDIKSIYEFFSKINIKNIKNNILLDYIEHVELKYKSLTTVSTKPIDEWDICNWFAFCDNEIDKLAIIKKNDWDSLSKDWNYWNGSWCSYGRYAGYSVQIHFSKIKDYKLSLNFCFRWIVLTGCLIEKCGYSTNGKDSVVILTEEEENALRWKIKNFSKMFINGYNKKQIAKAKTKFTFTNQEALINTITEYISDFYNVFGCGLEKIVDEYKNTKLKTDS
jgi:hypothetical protein